MARFYGEVGFGDSVQTRPGVWEDVVTVRKLRGDITRKSQRFETTDQVNDDIKANNTISIVASGYILQNLSKLRFIKCMGIRWKVASMDLSQSPRIIFELGGVYTGPTEQTGTA